MTSINFQSAINAYSNAANMAKNVTPSAGEDGAKAFANMLNNTINHATNDLRTAESYSAKALVNQADITDVVTAVNKAETTLQTVIALRDRLINAHQEIMRMPI